MIVDPVRDLEALLSTQERFLIRHFVGDDLFFDLIPQFTLTGEIKFYIIEADVAFLLLIIVTSIAVFFKETFNILRLSGFVFLC